MALIRGVYLALLLSGWMRPGRGKGDALLMEGEKAWTCPGRSLWVVVLIWQLGFILKDSAVAPQPLLQFLLAIQRLLGCVIGAVQGKCARSRFGFSVQHNCESVYCLRKPDKILQTKPSGKVQAIFLFYIRERLQVNAKVEPQTGSCQGVTVHNQWKAIGSRVI